MKAPWRSSLLAIALSAVPVARMIDWPFTEIVVWACTTVVPAFGELMTTVQLFVVSL